MPNRSLRTSALALAGILIAIGGCAESPSASEAREFVTRGSHARFDVSGSASAVIGASGGTLVTAAGDRIIFPTGALAEATRVSITSSGTYVGVELQPHGLRFPTGRQPVLVLNTGGSNVAAFRRLDVSYIDETGTVVEVLPAAAGAGSVTTTLSHFSTYRAGGFLTSGH
ncbi:MAG TPA: hypothetical protein VGB66_01650 [Longimicrobium sp.]|jgi:hypothetical protein